MLFMIQSPFFPNRDIRSGGTVVAGIVW